METVRLLVMIFKIIDLIFAPVQDAIVQYKFISKPIILRSLFGCKSF